ncbi:lamin tail domain-containing protein [Candidatus Berkelbacteria bacterium]|nr:lamin tail domain-containing protein [Candidatus Berkelbacteria bacterium]
MLNFKKVTSIVLTGLVTLQSVAILFVAKPVQAANSASIVISEIKWGGTVASVNDAWIELYNRSTQTVNLTNWKLSNASLDGSDIILSGNIKPNNFFLISRFNLQNPNSVLNITPDLTTNITSKSKLHLKSICQNKAIILKNGSGTVVDTVGCNGDKWLAGSFYAAMERIVTNKTLGGWYNSVSHINLDHTSRKVFASPKFINDKTPPTNGFIIDGSEYGKDIEYHNNRNYLPVLFGGFFDPETKIKYFKVGFGTKPGLDDAIPFVTTTHRQLSLKAPVPLKHNQRYYAVVRAYNGAGAVSQTIISNGVIVDVEKPLPPSNVTATDTPNDNGTAIDVTWTNSLSTDLITYTIAYNEAGSSVVNIISSITANSYRLTNLTPNKSYIITVRSVDFSTRRSAEVYANPVTTLINPSPIGVVKDNVVKATKKVIIATSSSITKSDSNTVSTPKGGKVTNVPAGSSDNNNDWLRISIVALLLLIIASGFYALSRAYGDTDTKGDIKPLAIKKQKSEKVKTAETKSKTKKQKKRQ